MSDLVPVQRPNGKTYRPRKPPRAIRIEDHEEWRENEACCWVYVLGTHDIERAWRIASNTHGADRETAYQTWIRQTMRDGDAAYDIDPERGAAAVVFEVWE